MKSWRSLPQSPNRLSKSCLQTLTWVRTGGKCSFSFCSKCTRILISLDFGSHKFLTHHPFTSCVVVSRETKVNTPTECSTDSHQHQIDLSLANVKNPNRMVKSRLYFSSESHLHAIFNLLFYGGYGDFAVAHESLEATYKHDLNEDPQPQACTRQVITCIAESTFTLTVFSPFSLLLLRRLTPLRHGRRHHSFWPGCLNSTIQRWLFVACSSCQYPAQIVCT